MSALTPVLVFLFVVLVVIGLALLGLGLCKAAARGDRMSAAAIRRDRKS